MTEEQAKAKLADRMWRLSHLYKIRTKDQKLVTFKPNRAQADYLQNQTGLDDILKARQLGFTTLDCIDDFDATITTPNTVTAIVAHEKDKVQKLFEIVRLAYDELPELLRPKAQYDNRNELYFPELKSKIFVAIDTRGETVHRLHISEVAFMKDDGTRLAGIMESVPKGGKVSWESSANGTSGRFYDEWNDTHSIFKRKHFYNWTWDKEYQEPTSKTLEQLLGEYEGLAHHYGLIPDLYERFNLTPGQLNWYIGKVRMLKQLVMQEYPTTDLEAFIAAGRNVFHIQDLQKHITSEPIERKYGDLLVWEKPMQGFKYVIGVDSSEGIGRDNAVIEVVNAHTGNQAAEFASNSTPPDDLGDIALMIAREYNNAFIVPEVNNHGIMVMSRLKGKYANVYQRQAHDEHTIDKADSLGWKTTSVTKPLLVDELEEAVRDQAMQINSEEAIKEMKVFVRTDEQGKQGFGAEGSNKDDRVIALGLCKQGMKDMPRLKIPKTEAQKRLDEYIQAKNLSKYFPNEQANNLINRLKRPNHRIRR